MKKILIHICFSMIMYLGNAQVVINLNVKGNLEDRLSQSAYDQINTSNTTLAGQELLNKGSIELLTPIFNEQLKELTSFNSRFEFQKTAIRTFISGPVFSSAGGFNSYGYIQEKYPIINPLSPSSVVRNTVTRARFRKKLNKERDKMMKYLDKNNPIPEGERVFLVLSTLESVINLTLENGKF